MKQENLLGVDVSAQRAGGRDPSLRESVSTGKVSQHRRRAPSIDQVGDKAGKAGSSGSRGHRHL